ncbi:MAG: nitroreductase family protein [Phaeodactylibacter sp.]|uniref:nitroreductase family protein n=1 Tax=Phaeodactylibacter sp. TaxID=1940289 RepID=UPI0032EB8E68
MSQSQLPADKTAQTESAVHPLIKKRWSPRAFAERPINDQDLAALFEAASWAASSYNEQPWQYLYAHRADEAGFNRLLSCILEGNRAWAQGASVLVLSLAQANLARTGKPNRHYFHDTGAANTNFLLQAADMDIYGHMMGGFDFQKTVAEFDLEEGLEPVCFMALGYLGDPEQLEEPLRSREQAPRSRKSVDTFTHKITAS